MQWGPASERVVTACRWDAWLPCVVDDKPPPGRRPCRTTSRHSRRHPPASITSCLRASVPSCLRAFVPAAHVPKPARRAGSRSLPTVPDCFRCQANAGHDRPMERRIPECHGESNGLPAVPNDTHTTDGQAERSRPGNAEKGITPQSSGCARTHPTTAAPAARRASGRRSGAARPRGHEGHCGRTEPRISAHRRIGTRRARCPTRRSVARPG